LHYLNRTHSCVTRTFLFCLKTTHIAYKNIVLLRRLMLSCPEHVSFLVSYAKQIIAGHKNFVIEIVQYPITHLSHAKKNHLYLPRPFQTGPCRRLRKNRRCAMHTPFWCKTCYWSTAAKIFSETPAR
jgi:hypothetical protein